MLPDRLASGDSIDSHPDEMPIQHPGPLTIEARCHGERMPALTMQVDQRAAPLDVADAIVRAVDATQGLFAACAPSGDSTVEGSIGVPESGVPPMAATCGARVETYPGFSTVDLMAVTPPLPGGALPDLPPGPPVPLMPLENLPAEPNIEMIVWRVVVTPDGAFGGGSTIAYRTQPRDAMAEDWSLGPDGWEGPGGTRCGGSGGGGGWYGGSVVYIDVCARG
jgi:hypothetical protein